MTTDVATIDHVALGLSRVAMQYQASPNFIAYLTAILSLDNELEGVFQQIAQQVDIDVASGVNLDTIGVIVGISRVLPGGPRNPLPPDQSILTDAQYRLLLRAKIVKNHSRGTNEDLLKGLMYVFGTASAAIDDNNDMTVSIGVGKVLNTVEQVMLNLLDILPRPAGVQIRYRAMYDINNHFDFMGQAHALGFGEEGQPLVGGIFAEEF